MKFRWLALVAMAACLPLAVAACGGDDDTNSGSRPTKAQLSEAITKELGANEPPEGVVDCVAEKVHASDIPNGVLRAIVEGRDAEVDKDNEGDYTKILTEAGASCAAEAAGQ